MIQFYLLSVVLNAAAGLMLIFTKEVPEDGAEADAASLPVFETKFFRLILGFLTLFTGIIKLFSAQGGIPVFGDFFPALAGLLAGSALLYEYYASTASIDIKLPDLFTLVFIQGRKYVGIFCILIASLHFIFPRVLFL